MKSSDTESLINLIYVAGIPWELESPCLSTIQTFQEISRYRWIWIYIGFRRYPGIGGYGYTLSSGDIQV